MVVDVLGVGMIVIGLILFAVELTHPGALLLIPGSVLVMAGLLYVFFPNTLLATPWGVVAIVLAAIVATIAQIPYYRYIAPVHRPMTSTSAGFTGQSAVVIAPIVPNSLKGKVRVGSEVWSARADRPIAAGTQVRVVSGEGVSLKVVPIEDGKPA